MIVAKKGLFYLSIGVYALLRLLFPPLELTGDSYGYACEILTGDLWNAHHLLHKYIVNDIWLVLEPLKLFKNPLTFYRTLHLATALASLFVLMRILELRHWSYTRIYLALLFITSGFAFIKYSVENEVYFYPILISLIGSLQFEKGKPIRAAILLGFATLFHQIHIFWLLGLLFPKDWRKYTHYYPLAIGLFVPVLTYTVIGLASQTPLYTLLFHDVQEGLVQTIPNATNFILYFVNTTRVFIQVHGDIALFWNLWNPYYSGIALLNFIFVLIGLIIYLRERRYTYVKTDWYRPYIIAFCLQSLFACYSVGNIEFMIVLPFLFILTLRNGSLLKHSLLFSISLLFWNSSQWAIPMAKTRPNRINDIIQISDRIIRADISGEARKTDATVIHTTNAVRIQNAFQYQYLYDSLQSDKQTDPLTRKPNLAFKEYVADSIKSGDYVLNYLHGRLNRAKVTYTEIEPKSLKELKFNRLYRDTGISGVMELYRVTQKKTPDS